MRRRAFIAGFGASAAWPFAARAQQPGKIYHVGLLASRAIPEGEERRKAMVQVLAAHGFVEGRNLQFEPRWGDGLSENAEALKHPKSMLLSPSDIRLRWRQRHSQKSCPSFAVGQAIQSPPGSPTVWRDPAAI